MSNIMKKIIAVSLICAMSVSMAACSDKKSSKEGSSKILRAEDIKTATLTSEEAEKLKKVEFSISEYQPIEGNEQDPVEQDGQSSAGSNEQPNGNNNAQNPGNANTPGGAESSAGSNEQPNGNNNAQNPGNANTPGGADSSADNNNVNNNDNNLVIDNGDNSASAEPVITGTKKIQQAIWMNLAGDYVFDGEYITATFEIKETTANGTYPITVEWLDFSNINAKTLEVTGVNGSVVVGGSASETQFKNNGTFEVKADSVSGNPGDTVTVSFRVNNNPGFCAFLFRFAYDSDALEYVYGSQGDDFIDAIENQNKEG